MGRVGGGGVVPFPWCSHKLRVTPAQDRGSQESYFDSSKKWANTTRLAIGVYDDLPVGLRRGEILKGLSDTLEPDFSCD